MSMAVTMKFNFSLITPKMIWFQKFWGLSRCCLAYCGQDVLWHWRSSGFLLATWPCSPFFFFNIWCILKQPHHHFSVVKPVCQLKSFMWFSLHPELFSWQLPEPFTGLPDRGLISTESLIFHSLIRVWTLLIDVLKCLDQILYPFPALSSSTTFSRK